MINRSLYIKYHLRASVLRKKGLSYTEIQARIPVTKSTISYWCRNISLSEKQMQRLKRVKLEGSKKGRFLGIQSNKQKKYDQIKTQLEAGIIDVGKLNQRDKFITGISLYAAEGGRSGKHISFANTDSQIISFMMMWFRKYCKISESKFKGALWIHDNLDKERAKIFWSKLTEIPLDHFHKTYVAKNKVDSKKIRKNKHEYGVFSIRICDLKTFRLIQGWMAGIFSASMV